jgi:spermidine synthase
LLSDARQAWIPLLLHPEPRTALFLGLGTGLTAGSASWDANLKVDVVELLPEVAQASADFLPALASKHRPNIVIADARRYVRTPGPQYDVIVADLFHPARSGAGALYTVEHFLAVKNRLAKNGLFCQWLPVHQLDLDSLRSIVAAFTTAYPNATALLATNSLDTPTLGLVGWAGQSGVHADVVRARVVSSPKSRRLPELHLEDELAVLGSFVAGPNALHRFASGAPVNTDDHPVVTHHAPFLTYSPTSAPRERLVVLLQSFEVEPADILAGSDDATRARLNAYWAARTHFIEVGSHVEKSADVRKMLTQVRTPLLEILRASPDFRPAYDPLLNMAAALSQEDSAGARALLMELANTQPARPEAHMLLQQLATVATTPKT